MEPKYNQRYAATKHLTIINASSNFLLAVAKLIIGYFSHSQSLIADGFHSLSDILNDGFILVAAFLGQQIPDKEHPYGHQRIETMASMILALLMFGVGFGILYTNSHSLWHNHGIIEHSLPVIVTSLLAIIVYTTLSHYNYKVGKSIHSNLLISNSYHNRSDAYTSSIVLLTGIGASLHWHYLDLVGAIIIALLIIKMGIHIFWNGLQELIDAGVDDDTLQKMLDCVTDIPGVTAIHQLRTRMHGGAIFVDIHMIVAPFISVSEGHHIGEQAHLKLVQTFTRITDVVIHIDPEDDEKNQPCLYLPPRHLILQQLRTAISDQPPPHHSIQNVNIHYYNGQVYLDIILTYPPTQKDAEASVQYYQQLRKKLKNIAKINVYFSFADNLLLGKNVKDHTDAPPF